MADKNSESIKTDSMNDKKKDVGASQRTYDRRSGRGLIIGLTLAGLLIVGAVVAGGAWMIRTAINEKAHHSEPVLGGGLYTRFNDSIPFGYGRSIQTEITDDKVTTTVYTYQTGVVVAVNSDNIVIAGNGKQSTIKTNDSTTYINDEKPAVNDTVVIAGTTEDNTTTATQIRVANRT